MMKYRRKEVIGDCILYLADNADILPHLQDIGAIVTDPPYGINMDDGHGWDSSAPDIAFLLELNKPTIIWGGELLYSTTVTGVACLA